jgi:hypothetical protein
MIFSHIQKPLELRKTRVGKRISVCRVPVGTTWFCPYCCATVDTALVQLLPAPGFQVLPKRWVVERTFSWIDQNRRMSEDCEKLCASGAAFTYAAMSRLMVRRLTRL